MEKRWSRKKRANRDAGETRRAPLGESAPVSAQRPVQKPVVEEIVALTPEMREAAPADAFEPPVEPMAELVPEARPETLSKPEPLPEAPAAPSVIVPEPTLDQTEDLHDQWEDLATFQVDATHLERNRVITAARDNPAHSAFDVLRTKLLRALRDNGWTRVAITSPTEGCGKTFMSVNLALSLSRQANCRTILMDLDMRRPSVAKVMGLQNPGSMGDFLRGDEHMCDFLRRAGDNDLKIGNNIAVGGNGRREDYASELMQLPETAETIDAMEAALNPDLILFDMPPALVNDDVLAARPLFDGVLVIVGGGITKPQQVRDVERRLGAETPLLGVVLNRSEGESAQAYSY